MAAADGLLGGDCAGTGGQAIGPVELLLGPAELAAPPVGQPVLPRLGDFPCPPQRRPTDLVPCQLFDSLQHTNRLAGIEIDANFVGHPVSQVEASRGQRIGRCPDPLGQVEIFDRAGEIVDPAATRRPSNQVERQPAAELDRMMMVCHAGRVARA